MRKRKGSGSVPLTNESVSGRPETCESGSPTLVVSLMNMLAGRNLMASTSGMSQEERDEVAERCNSVFLNEDSLDCALLAAGKQHYCNLLLAMLLLQLAFFGS
jgi:hypothetical protein